MKFFRSDQIKKIDAYTIKEEPVTSVDLMERAAGQLLRWYIPRYERSGRVLIFAGPGNNGGDGLALARLLEENRYDVEVYYIEFSVKTSEDWKINLDRLKKETKIKVNYITVIDEFPVVFPDDKIIDAIFGSGLTRPVHGLAQDVIKKINQSGSTIISIDIPSGLFGEDNADNVNDSIVSADYTLSFQFPKLSFMFAENSAFLGEWTVLPIGLSANSIKSTISPYIFLGKEDVVPLLKQRNKFDHKGIYGHGLLISGSIGKMGAAVMGAGAALRSGIGLITCHLPFCGASVMQGALPEAMVVPDANEKYVSDIGVTDSFNAIGIGPGLGTKPVTCEAVTNILSACRKPIVIDADALNIISLDKNRLSLIPEGAILTPHPMEFERLAGKTNNSYQRLSRQIEFSKEYNCIVVLKGANTSITSPDGNVFFNSTGNPGMATAGSGDVLTGILLSLLAQGYPPINAAIFGVYLHGLAGDIAAEELCYESIIASDIIKNLSGAFKRLKE